MRKSRKICCRITPRRILGAVLLTASLVNLIIVGTAFEISFPDTVPTPTATPRVSSITGTFSAPTATSEVAPTVSTPASILSPTATLTPTATPTSTETPSPSPAPCVPRSVWPIYIVQDGDTLWKLQIATGATVDELMVANCLPDTTIYKGQRLYLPRLPATPTDTMPPNTSTGFLDPSVSCPDTNGIGISVTVFDPEGISFLSATYRLNDSQSQSTIQMTSQGNSYSGSGLVSAQPGPVNMVYYYFTAVDFSGSATISMEYQADMSGCYGITDIG